MDLKQRPGLKGLMANRNKGSTSKGVSKTQVPTNLPPPPSATTVGLLPNPDLKKKRKVPEAEEGEVIPQKGTKQPKNAKDKRAPSVESKEETDIDMRRGSHTWALWIEVGVLLFLGMPPFGSPKEDTPPNSLRP